QELAGHVIKHAVERAGVEGGQVEDVILGAALQQGSQGSNVARQGALRAGLPVTVPGMSIDRQCSSGLMAIATAAKQVLFAGPEIVGRGGVASVSLVRRDTRNTFRGKEPRL